MPRGLPSADALDDLLPDVGPAVVARAGAPQIVEEHSRQPHGVARRIPRGGETAERASRAVENEGALGHALRPAAGHEREQGARERERQRLLVLRHGAGEAHAAAHHRARPVELELEPRPDGAERVAAPEIREVGELGRIGHGRRVQLAELAEEPRELRWIDEALAHVVLRQQRHHRHGGQQLLAHRDAERAAECRELAVDGRGGRAARDPRVSVAIDPCRGDGERQIPGEHLGEMGELVLEPRAIPLAHVVGAQQLAEVLEPQPLRLRRHEGWRARGAQPLAQERLRLPLVRGPRALPDRLALVVVGDPPRRRVLASEESSLPAH
jgi:hypothetical protein